ncbi:MAG: hypothetical protein PHV91_08760 [Bacteroidales bacterium]|nr:hypothetical protein [Bacteroidales bacterium]
MHPYESEAIIYLSSGTDDPFNQAIVKNYSFIQKRVREETGIPFIYLPKLLLDKGFQRMMSYNRPYISNYIHADLRKLTEEIKKQYNIITDRPAFVYISQKDDEGYCFELAPPIKKLSREDLSKQIDTILEKIEWIKNKNEILEDKDTGIRFSMGDDTFSDIFSEDGEEYGNDLADANFNSAAFKVPGDLMEKINELKEAGYLSRLIEFLEELQKTTRKLSRLRITQDYRIYLMDYKMKEVKMSPLPKALYLLFLKHPEGILFKELTDFRTELMDIYKNITLRESPDKARENIIRVTDPHDNSINEKCSQIRIAFLKVVSEEIAENYYITGRRGEPKNITLDRELVINEHTSRLQGL